MTFMVNYKFISYQWQIMVATGQFGFGYGIFLVQTNLFQSVWVGLVPKKIC